MNKSFKVVFNKARGALMVVNEVTSSVQAKGTKTVIAAAVATLALGSTVAVATENTKFNQVTVESILDQGKKDATFKFHSAKGEKTVIKTEASATQFASDMKKFLESKDLGDLRKALTQLNIDKGTGILLGYSGGYNIIDYAADETLKLLGKKSSSLKKLANQFANIEDFKTENTQPGKSEEIVLSSTHDFKGSTLLITQKSENGQNGPLLLGTVVGDRVVNTGFEFGLIAQKEGVVVPIKASPESLEITREGNAVFNHQAGNLLGVVTGSSAINVGQGINVSAMDFVNLSLKASSTNVTLKGNTRFEASNDACSAGVINGGSAIALNGKANSTVTGESHIRINNTKENEPNGNLNTLHVGLAGGGLAVSALGGESTAKVQGDTHIDLESGLVGGVIGGGIAVAAQATDLKPIIDKITGKPNENDKQDEQSIKIDFNQDLLNMPGHATAESQNVNISVGPKMTAGLLVGGGLAAHYQFGDAQKPANTETIPGAESTVKDVNIELGGDKVSTEKVEVDKSKLFATVKDFVTGVGSSVSKDENGTKIDFTKLKDASLKFIYDIDDHDGVTVGVLGGGAAIGYDRERGANNKDFTANAKASVENVNIHVNSGYNVALVGGGLAAGSGHSLNGDQILAESNVNHNVNMVFNGGETVGVMGGGTAIWAGSAEAHTGIGAKAFVDEVNLTVNGGSVDGLFGGGYAIDDSNPKVKGDYVAANNALSQVNTVNIQVAKA